MVLSPGVIISAVGLPQQPDAHLCGDDVLRLADEVYQGTGHAALDLQGRGKEQPQHRNHMRAGPLQLRRLKQPSARELGRIPKVEEEAAHDEGAGSIHCPFHHLEVCSKAQSSSKVRQKQEDDEEVVVRVQRRPDAPSDQAREQGERCRAEEGTCVEARRSPRRRHDERQAQAVEAHGHGQRYGQGRQGGYGPEQEQGRRRVRREAAQVPPEWAMQRA
mmetsp:Transcript_68308/g.189011  ORF Transcript_68308/g.189011 Transcript_68308/m.189011 type:complete len:218 (+) Transcript_68308:93-746(+)